LHPDTAWYTLARIKAGAPLAVAFTLKTGI
jgi:hypothetical protein